jgi:hypothetical protein
MLQFAHDIDLFLGSLWHNTLSAWEFSLAVLLAFGFAFTWILAASIGRRLMTHLHSQSTK